MADKNDDIDLAKEIEELDNFLEDQDDVDFPLDDEDENPKPVFSSPICV